ncbi:hypothetical protein ONZ45_g7056 [Pleurotus djamor]|nr:hypothetical protein ONZ45_g7056 [Pleurotus djamor]
MSFTDPKDAENCPPTPTSEQITEWWSLSQLRLPPYRFKHNTRYHPYIRYVDAVDTVDYLDNLHLRTALRRNFTLPPPPPPPVYQQEAQAAVPRPQNEPKTAEELERLRYLQVRFFLSTTILSHSSPEQCLRNLRTAADALANGPAK